MAETASPVRRSSEKRQRSYVAQFRCSDAERAQLEAQAERAGLSPSAYMRHQCLGTAGPRAGRRPPVERAALAQVLAQLGKCGSNLNQIARALNSQGEVRQDIDEAVADFRAACAAITAMLGKGAA